MAFWVRAPILSSLSLPGGKRPGARRDPKCRLKSQRECSHKICSFNAARQPAVVRRQPAGQDLDCRRASLHANSCAPPRNTPGVTIGREAEIYAACLSVRACVSGRPILFLKYPWSDGETSTASAGSIATGELANKCICCWEGGVRRSDEDKMTMSPSLKSCSHRPSSIQRQLCSETR